ncbi:MAG: radical SAM protein [Anaerolineales bacterium]|nr:radical SAM protein [Anaerolineales bacterium]
MTLPKWHLFSDGQTHIAYNPENMTFYRLTDQAWAERHLAEPATDSPPVPEAGSAPTQEEPSSRLQAVFAVPVNEENWTLERLVMIVTTHCNLRCRYCYAKDGAYGMPRQQMDANLARRAVDWMLQLFSFIATLQFFGGEPSLNYEAIRAVCEAFEQHYASGRLEKLPQYAMVTNGTCLPPRLEELIRRYGMHVTYSIDGPPEVHDRNRFFMSGKGSFQKTIANFKRLRLVNSASVGVEMTFSPQALDAGYGIWELAQFSRVELGLPEPHIAPVASEPGGVTSWDRRIEEAVASYRIAAANSLQSLLDGQYVSFSIVSGMLRTLISKRPRNIICPAGAATLAVDPQGDIYPCFMFAGHSAVCLGNVNTPADRKILADRLRAFMRHNRKDTHAACRECWARSLCSGCLGDTQLSTGSLEGESPLMCAIMKAVAEETMLFLAKIRNDAEAWRRFVNHYRQWRLDLVNPAQVV